MRLKITLLLFLTTIGLSQLRAQCSGAQFQEVNGIAVIEAESPSTPSTWRRETASNPYTGNSYLAYRGPSAFNNPGTNVINYSVRINSPGTYRFIWRNKVGIIANTNPSTEHNDSWLKIQASNFYAQKGNSRVYPKGSGKTPVPEGAGAGGWFKIYSSGTTNWTWSTNTFDNNAHQIYAVFNNAGVYTIQVSARSQGHFIDRLILYKEGSYSISEAQNLGRAQTNCGGGSPPPPPPPTGDPAINSFSYVNAGTDNVIGTLNNGAQINISNGPSNLAFRANANGDTGSVRLQLSGPVSNALTDNNVPYSSFGDSGNNYTGRTMQVGNYTLTATPYAQDNLGGAQGTANTISFSVVSNTTPPPPPPPTGDTGITGFNLINANTNGNLGAITQGKNFTNVPSSLSIRANTNPTSVGNVSFTLSGPVNANKNEGSAPYHVFGDVGVNPVGRSLPNGNYTITARPSNGSPLTVSFSIGNSTNPPPPSGGDAITYTWINAGTDSNLQLINNGTTISGTGSNRNIRVNTTFSLARSVFFRLQGRQSRTWTENVQPYALYGDNNGNYNSANFPSGSYSLTVQIYAGLNRTGSLLGSETINFNVGSASSKEAIGAAYVYPNPIKDGKFSVKLPETMKGEVSYSLINASGNTIEQGKVSVSAAGDTAEFNMDASSYKHGGMYYIVLQSGETRYTLPLIKK